MIGNKFGKLLILEEVEKYKYNNGQTQRQFKCKCECGNIVKVRLASLKSGNTKSCGCDRLKFDKSTRGLQNLFRTIKQRCNNPNATGYKYWGGRGIKCEWNNFKEFYNDMGKMYNKGLTIERINVNGNYCKDNCIWISNSEQVNNRRNTILYKGKTLKKYCDENNLKYYTVWNRIKRLGWDVEKAINI